MISDAHLAQLRALIEAILDERGVRKVPADITDKRRKAAKARWQKHRDDAAHDAHAMQSASPRKARKLNGSEAHAMQTREIWKCYSAAYIAKYGTEPVRNAKVNGQLAQLIKRIGPDAADMVVWYVEHRAQRYLMAGHTIGLLLMDAEKLHTEWATGRRMTATEAQQADRRQATGEVFAKLITEARKNGKIA